MTVHLHLNKKKILSGFTYLSEEITKKQKNQLHK